MKSLALLSLVYLGLSFTPWECDKQKIPEGKCSHATPEKFYVGPNCGELENKCYLSELRSY